MDDDRSKQVSRRTAMRVWLAGASSLTLLAAAGSLAPQGLLAAPADQTGGPAPVQVPAATPAPARPAASPAPVSAAPAPASAPAAVTPVMCIMTPEQTEGPYYIDTDLIRSDITEDKPGAPPSSI